MILWLNGTYGVGKTTIAYKIVEKYNKTSKVFDPDLLWKQTIKKNPMMIFGDGAYPRDNKRFLKILIDSINQIIKEYNGLIIVPMTIVNEEALKNIQCAIDVRIKHIVLLANEDVIRQRVEIQEKTSSEKRDLSMLKNDLVYLNNNFINDDKIDTTYRKVEDIAEDIIRFL